MSTAGFTGQGSRPEPFRSTGVLRLRGTPGDDRRRWVRRIQVPMDLTPSPHTTRPARSAAIDLDLAAGRAGLPGQLELRGDHQPGHRTTGRCTAASGETPTTRSPPSTYIDADCGPCPGGTSPGPRPPAWFSPAASHRMDTPTLTHPDAPKRTHPPRVNDGWSGVASTGQQGWRCPSGRKRAAARS